MSNRSHATTTAMVTAWSERSGWRWWWRRGGSVSLVELDVSGGDKAGLQRTEEAGAAAVRLEGLLYYRKRTRRILKQVYGKGNKETRKQSWRLNGWVFGGGWWCGEV